MTTNPRTPRTPPTPRNRRNRRDSRIRRTRRWLLDLFARIGVPAQPGELGWAEARGLEGMEPRLLLAVAPIVTDVADATRENVPLTFTTTDFSAGFSDADVGDTLQSVQITTLPLNGNLTLSSVPVVPFQSIPTTSLGNLVYTPSASFMGTDSFRWNGSDGTFYAAADAAMNLTVNVPLAGAITLQGNGTTIPAGDTTPSRTDFTDFAYVGVASGTVTRTFSIVNSGDLPLNLTGTPKVTLAAVAGTVGAGDFRVTAQPGATINGAQSATFTISFDPSAAGVRTARVSIASSDAANSSFTFVISGTGLLTTTFPDGLQVAITQAAPAGAASAILGQELEVNYTGYLLNGTVFDTSLASGRTPFDFAVGEQQVIQGWDEGLLGQWQQSSTTSPVQIMAAMKVGETRVVIVPAALGYGATAQGSIPANSTLIFEVQLLTRTGPGIQVTGNGIPIADGDTTTAAADATDFGSMAPGDTVTHTFTLSNTLSGSLMFMGNPWVQLGGAQANQFTLTQPVIASNQATFTISYKPTAFGAAKAVVVIPTNDPAHGSYNFTVGGTAIQTAPNLTGTFIATTIPGTVGAGDRYTVPLVVMNQGWQTSVGKINVTLVASTDANYDVGSDPVLATLTNVSIALGHLGMVTLPLTFTIPAIGTLPAGAYRLLAKIDPVAGATVVDSDLSNNVVGSMVANPALLPWSTNVPLSLVVVPTTGPDLTVSVGAPLVSKTTYVPGDYITLPVTVSNRGVVPAVGTAPDFIKVAVRLSADNVYDETDPLLGTLTVAALARNSSVTQYLTVRLPGSSVNAGSVYVVAKADATNNVSEFDETDNTAAQSSAMTFAWQFGAVTGRVGATPLVFNDTDGTLVTMQLVGPGTGTLAYGAATGYALSLTGTTAASTVIISTALTATPGDDGRFALRNLTVGAPATATDHTALGMLLASTTDLLGAAVNATGPVTSMTFGNVTGDPVTLVNTTFTLGAPATAPVVPPTVSLRFDLVGDLAIISGIGIANLTATRWLDANAVPDRVSAPFLGTLTVTGSAPRGVAGDFQAALNLLGPNGTTTAQPTLGNATIAGSVPGLTWHVVGKIGALSIGGAVGASGNAFQIGSDTTDIATLSLGDVVNAGITPSGNLGTVTAQRWQAGLLSAKTLTLLNVTGKAAAGAAAAIPGDFQAALTLAGPALATGGNVLGAATIAGAVGATTWDITGKVGTVTIRGTLGTAGAAYQLVHATDVALLNLGDVTNAAVTAAGNLGTILAQRWLAGGLSAKALTLLNITGKPAVGLVPAIPGNFGADLTLAGPVAAGLPVLGTAIVAGQITGGTWSLTGSATTIIAASAAAAWTADLTIGGAAGNLTTLVLTSPTATDSLHLTANALGTVQVLGNLTGSNLHLLQTPSATRPALTYLYVAKTMSQSAIRSAGNLGTVVVGVLDHSLIFAGVQDLVTVRPALASDFVSLVAASLPTISLVYLTGLATSPTAPALIDSSIAAGKITTAVLPNRATAVSDTDSVTAPFGFATRSGVTTYVGPDTTGVYVSGKDSTIGDTNPAVADLAGRNFQATLDITVAPFSQSFLWAFSTTGGAYLMIGSPTTFANSQGGWTYHANDATTGTFTVTGWDLGAGSGTITFLNATKAVYRLTRTADGIIVTGTLTIGPVAQDLAPADVGGRVGAGTITAGGGQLAARGTFQAALSQSNDHYALIGGAGTGSTTGTYAYQKINGTVAALTFTSPTVGTTLTGLTFRSATAADFVTTGTSGNWQRGTLTAPAPSTSAFAPASAAGRSANASITGGGTFHLTFDNAGGYSLVGGPGVPNSGGTYVYEQYAPNLGVFTFTQTSPKAGQGWGLLTFTSTAVASFTISDDQGKTRTGTMTFS